MRFSSIDGVLYNPGRCEGSKLCAISPPPGYGGKFLGFKFNGEVGPVASLLCTTGYCVASDLITGATRARDSQASYKCAYPKFYCYFIFSHIFYRD